MKYFYGYQHKKNYFEGWYLKHQNTDFTFACIPSYHIHKDGQQAISLQIVTPDKAYAVRYPAEVFYAYKDTFHVQIGSNIFSENFTTLHINTPDLQLNGTLTYTNFTPPKFDIMGPFKNIPFMQCKHGISSMKHQVNGTLELNGITYLFRQAVGYIEKDRGKAFPTGYLWFQCNQFKRQFQSSIMISIAQIPFGPIKFTGCICSIRMNNKEYCLATYKGVKIETYSPKEIILKQGDYLLKINILKDKPLPLNAPIEGKMGRTIDESLECTAAIYFQDKENIIINETTPFASYEYCYM